MDRRFTRVVSGLVLCLAVLAVIGTEGAHSGRPHAVSAAGTDWTPVGQAIGVEGKVQPGDVYRISLPRTDLHVMVGRVRVKAGFALGTHLEFMTTTSGAMMMGDLVLTESEIQPVMLKLEQGGIDVTAIHNHLLGEKPRIMYMHVMGSGDPVKLAEAVRAALVLSKTPLRATAPKASDSIVALDKAGMDAAIGTAGKVDGGLYKYSIAPKYEIKESGIVVPPAMGTSTGFTFQPLGAGHAAVTGDFALLAAQVNPVIRALRSNGIAVTALHSHMLGEDPTVFFMHFYATGDGVTLARGLRTALDAMG